MAIATLNKYKMPARAPEKRVNIRQNVDTSSIPYCGKQDQFILSDMLLTSKMIPEVRIVSGVSKYYTFAYGETDSGLQCYQCLFNAQGNMRLYSKQMSVCEYMINKQECKTNLQHFFCDSGAWETPSGFNPPEMIKTIEDWWIARTVAMISSQMDLLFWRSDPTLPPNPALPTIAPFSPTPENEPVTYNCCTGWLKLMSVDPDVLTVAGTTITYLNLQAEMLKIYQKIKASANVLLVNQNILDLRFYVPSSLIADFNMLYALTSGFFQGSIGAGINVAGFTAKDIDGGDTAHQFYFMGIPIVFTHGLPNTSDGSAVNDNIVFTFADNFIILTDLESDWEKIEVRDMWNVTFDNTMRLYMSFRLGMNYAWGKYIIWYH